MAKQSEGSNGFMVSNVPKYVGRIENLQKQIDDIMQKAKDACAPLREDIVGIKKEANETDNIPRRELNSTVRTRKLIRQIGGIRETMSDEQRTNYDAMIDQFDDLDDTPLGRAARNKSATGNQPTTH